LVPPGAGVGSAIGFLRAPFSFEANRSVYMRLSAFDPGKIRSLLQDLNAEATGFVRTCDATARIVSEYKVYMRYSGQGWEIPISLTQAQAENPDAGAFLARFEEDYAKLFGRIVQGMDVEITVWAVNSTTLAETVARVTEAPAGKAAQATGQRPVFDPAQAAYLAAEIVPRSSVTAGQTVAGPAVITEDETTIIVPASRVAQGQPDGCIDIVAKASKAGAK
jgi:N-methylhydantoinase A